MCTSTAADEERGALAGLRGERWNEPACIMLDTKPKTVLHFQD